MRKNIFAFARCALISAMFLFAFRPGVSFAQKSAEIAASRMRCEYLENPLGIDVTSPRLSWILASEKRVQVQSAYRILVASSKEKLGQDTGDLWDSGKVMSDETIQIVYKGSPLKSRTHCFWKVMVWDRDGRASAWSDVAFWSMGLLSKDDWKAKWIGLDTTWSKLAPELAWSLTVIRVVTPWFGPLSWTNGGKVYQPCPYLRKTFSVDKPVKRAEVHVSALGLFELYLNGQRVGKDFFTPGWTDYNKRVYYLTYDVTDLVRAGKENVIGAILSDGWYAGNVGGRGQ
jgi:alpha-L-rhamnosidase